MFGLCSDEWASALQMCEMSADGSCQTRTLQMVKNKPNNSLWFRKCHVQNSTSGLLRLSDWKKYFRIPPFKAFNANSRTISLYTPIEHRNFYIYFRFLVTFDHLNITGGDTAVLRWGPVIWRAHRFKLSRTFPALCLRPVRQQRIFE